MYLALDMYWGHRYWCQSLQHDRDTCKLTFTLQRGKDYGGRYVRDFGGQREDQLSLAGSIKEDLTKKYVRWPVKWLLSLSLVLEERWCFSHIKLWMICWFLPFLSFLYSIFPSWLCLSVLLIFTNLPYLGKELMAK